MTGQDLKNSILQLAIQGKLVAQDTNDEPASVLLERIKAEKKKLIEEKKIKKEKPLPEITDEEKPFEIPDSWVWCRLGEIITMLSGQDLTPDRYFEQEKGIPYITGASNLQNEKLIINRWTNTPTVKALIGDLLIVCKGSGVGKMAYCTVTEAHIARQIQCIRNVYSYVSLKYIKYVITYFLNEVTSQANGLIPGIARDVLLSHIIPLPPLSEQKRIVAKIEELMHLVDEYDKAQKELDALNNAMPEQLKQSILQEAIMGKLGTNNPDDEPASELLKRIRKEKEQLIKDKKIKKEKPLQEITDEEKPFDIPDNWVWCRIGDVFMHNNGKQLNKNKQEGVYMDYITTSNLYWDYFVLDNIKQMPFEKSEIDRCQAIKGDLLVCEGGDVGRACIWNYDYPIMLQNHIHKLRAYIPLVTRYFYYLFYNYNKCGKIGGKGIGIQGLSSNVLHNILVPLPPLAEQHRIVSKIENLFACIEPLAKDLK